jgi:molybdate transport system substrate-binding protein
MQHLMKSFRPFFKPFFKLSFRFSPLLVVALALPGKALWAADIHVMTSGGFTAAYNQLVPEFERATGHKVITAYGASMGNAPDAIPNRLARKERVDVVILAAPALEDLVKQGKVAAGSQVDLVRSLIGMSVRSGAPKPDIGSVDALRRTLLNAQSIAYSASASGVYISTELFQRLGIADQVSGKSKRILSERVGAVVARGEAELGFQQVSELLPVPGVDYVGPLPAEVQRVTVFSAGVGADAAEPDAAKALIRFFTSAPAAPVITQTGLEPLTRP